MAVLDDVKLLLDIPESDADLDNKLNLIIKNAERQVLSYLPSGLDNVPNELEYIVCELSVTRFNRLGNEGITYGDDIAPYLSAIQAWNNMQKNNTRGVVRFL